MVLLFSAQWTRLNLAFVLVTASLAAFAPAATGDTLYLENGDLLSGELIGLDAGAVRFTTPYAGEIQIDAAALAFLVSAGPVRVLLHDGATLEGAFYVADDRQMIETPEGALQIDPQSIAAIVPAGAPLPNEEPAEAEAEAEAAPAEEEEPPKLWSGFIESGLALRSGSTDRTDLSLGTALTRTTDRHVLSLSFNAAYAEVEDVINTRLYKGEGKWQYYPKDRLYLYWLVGAESDDAKKLDLRLNTAVGVGYDIIEQERRKWSADIGLDYAYERWNPFTPEERDRAKEEQRAGAFAEFRSLVDRFRSGSGIDSVFLRSAYQSILAFRDPLSGLDHQEEYFVSVRVATVFEQSIFEHGKLTESLVLTPSLDDIGEFRASSDFAFTTPLSEQLKLKVHLLTEYDSIAEEVGADPWQNTLTTGLRYDF